MNSMTIIIFGLVWTICGAIILIVIETTKPITKKGVQHIYTRISEIDTRVWKLEGSKETIGGLEVNAPTDSTQLILDPSGSKPRMYPGGSATLDIKPSEDYPEVDVPKIKFRKGPTGINPLETPNKKDEELMRGRKLRSAYLRAVDDYYLKECNSQQKALRYMLQSGFKGTNNMSLPELQDLATELYRVEIANTGAYVNQKREVEQYFLKHYGPSKPILKEDE